MQTTPTQSLPKIAPLPGETQRAFVTRVWDSLPFDLDVDKAKYCRDVWFGSGRDASLTRIADRHFPVERYRKVTGSAVFKEHTTKRIAVDPATGLRREEPTVYDANAIEQICERNNKRILESADFSPLCDGHTPDVQAIEKGVQQPDVLGYAGPFYLGKLGGVLAIYCDEHHDVSDLSRLDKLHRRSPEIWLSDRMDERIFDPIACLGAQTPRLDLGITRYGRTFNVLGKDGASLMKYSAPPAASSTFIPGADEDDKKRYAANPQDDSGESEMALEDNDVRQIVDAISQSAAFQAMQQLVPHVPKLISLAGGESADPGQGASPPAAPPADAQVPPPANGEGQLTSPPAAPPAAPEPPPAKEPYQADADDQSMLQRYMSGEADDTALTQHFSGKKQKYALPIAPMVAGAIGSIAGNAMSGSKDNYARDQSLIQKANYERALAEKDAELQALRTQARQSDRYSRLSAMAAQGFQFDVTEELNLTADFTDDQFNRHVEKAVAKYERIPLAVNVPVMTTPGLTAPVAKQSEHYQRQRREEIQNRVTRLREAGRDATWEEEAEKYDREHGVS
jgi:hypothetical protein